MKDLNRRIRKTVRGELWRKQSFKTSIHIFGHIGYIIQIWASFFSLQFAAYIYLSKFRGKLSFKEFVSIWSLRDGGFLRGQWCEQWKQFLDQNTESCNHSAQNHGWILPFEYIPRTQMTRVLIGKRPCFVGLTFKNRGQLGSRYIYICFLSKQFLLLYVSLYWLICDGILISWIHYLYISFVFALWNWEYKVSNMHRTTRGLSVHCYKWVVFRCPWSNIQIQNDVLGVKDSHL